MTKKIRKLKVYSQGDPWRRTEQPMIRFGGRWLRDAGFQPGQPYRIVVHAPGALTIDATPQHGELFAHWTAEDWQRLNAILEAERVALQERLRLQHQRTAGAERNEP